MPAFRFVAIDPQGQVRTGTMDAPDAGIVIERLQRDGNIPMRAEPAGWHNGLGAWLTMDAFGRGGLSRDDIALVLRELATMLGAGQDVDRALRFIAETAPTARLRRVMAQVRARLRGGAPLHVALAEPPASFPRLQVGLVRAGETGGTLAETLARLADMMDRERALARTITSALIYPAGLVVAAILSIGLLVGYVLPQFAPLFRDSGTQMPTGARLLMGLGDGVAVAWPYLLIAMLALVLGIPRILKIPRLRLPVDRMLLRLPIAGPLLRESNAARFCRTLGTLVANGVPLVSALAIVRETLANRAVQEALDDASASAKSGAGLAHALEAAHVFPTRTTHLLRLGEETAQLAPLAIRAAEIHEDRTRQGMQRLVSLLVPVITIVMGGVVASIVGSLLLAMLSLNDLAG